MQINTSMPFNISKYYTTLIMLNFEWNPEYKNKFDMFEVLYITDAQLSRKQCIACAEATGNFVASYYFKYHDCPPDFVLTKKDNLTLETPNIKIDFNVYTNIRNILIHNDYYKKLPDDHPFKTEEKGKIIETCINAFNAPDRKEARDEYIALLKDLNIYLELNLKLNQPKEKKELELKKRIKNYKKLQEFMVKTNTTNDKLIESINEVKNYIKEKIQLNETQDEFEHRLKIRAINQIIKDCNIGNQDDPEIIVFVITLCVNTAYPRLFYFLETKALKKMEKEIKKELELELEQKKQEGTEAQEFKATQNTASKQIKRIGLSLEQLRNERIKINENLILMAIYLEKRDRFKELMDNAMPP